MEHSVVVQNLFDNHEEHNNGPPQWVKSFQASEHLSQRQLATKFSAIGSIYSREIESPIGTRYSPSNDSRMHQWSTRRTNLL